MADGGRIGTLDPDDMIAAARLATGLQEFGAPDVRAPLQVLVDSLNKEANLTPAGEAGRRAALVRALSNRLRLNAAIERDPDIEREVIVRPIVVVGLPRSGTTKLQRVLAADPGLQKLPLWRLLEPVSSQPSSRGEVDPRVQRAEAYVAKLREGAPAMYAAHPMYATEADEEVFVMELAFLANINATAYRAPTLHEWLRGQSYESWYIWFKRLLQCVQREDRSAGRPWVLKAPHHMGFLPLLFRYFPDALVCHTHRDPAIAVSSFAALAQAARSANQFTADPRETGRYCLEYSAERVRTYVRDREALGRDAQFVDLAYRDVVSDVAGVAGRIYTAAGLELTRSALDAMHAWEREHAQHKHGRGRYTLEEFGLTRSEVESEFSEYSARFGRYF